MNARYVRFTVTATRGYIGTLQMAEFEVFSGEAQLAVTDCTALMDGSSPNYFNDQQRADKWYDGDHGSVGGVSGWSSSSTFQVTFTLAKPAEITQYRYVTGGDLPERDPVSWTLYISGNGTDWYIGDKREDVSITTDRNAPTELFTVGEHVGWYFDDSGILTNDYFPEACPEAMTKPYPAALWRIEPTVNSGLPYHKLLPDVMGVDMWALERKRTIHVYDLNEPQEGFDHNGLAVLDPISCTSIHEVQGRWDITLTHPLDDWGKWKNLLGQNVLKVDGQLFRIDMQEPEIDFDSRTITVHARHISYDLLDEVISYATFPGGTAAQFIDFVQSNTVSKIIHFDYRDRFTPYTFDIHTNISSAAGECDYFNCSIIAALIGDDNSFINRYGGELYRDNFYLSINSRMQYSRRNSFRLDYSRDIAYIKQSVDYSDFCTEIHANDNFGHYYAKMWYDGDNENGHWVLHHPKPRVVKFNFPSDGGFDQLITATNAYFDTVSIPRTCYEVRTAALRHDPGYEEFASFQDYRVGDTGTVYVHPLSVEIEQEITCLEKDELTGDVLNMKLGALKPTAIRPGYMAGTVSSGRSVADRQNQAMLAELKKTQLKALSSWGSAGTYTWSEIRKFTWKELLTHGC